ncbi:hypothetical protein EVAR_20765_1 [Eumeta japonica]|uniref:Uncharacterized protein n=1 Tax=Eumeta variegata TaxID=151549 RepID=A0A4C1VAK4_EUMVA|nr:hypothetical protein EVAR_20765_1 [Eumeta japonica]
MVPLMEEHLEFTKYGAGGGGARGRGGARDDVSFCRESGPTSADYCLSSRTYFGDDRINVSESTTGGRVAGGGGGGGGRQAAVGGGGGRI